MDEKVKVIMNSKTTSGHNFKATLGLKEFNIVLTKKIMSANKNNEFT